MEVVVHSIKIQIMKRGWGFPQLILTWVFLTGCVYCQKPTSVNIGAIFTFNSVIGRVARVAIQEAVSDVNSDPRILKGTQLNLFMKDAGASVFLGSIEAFQVLDLRVVAIIGPQSSGIAHMISELANGLQVPLISYAATDPTLSALQFPFFLRTTQSDARQMVAMANLIDFYGWKEVITLYVDSDYGRNGIYTLEDELEKKSLRIAYKIPLPIGFNLSYITDLLNQSKLLGPRVYIVHVVADPSLTIFSVAKKLQMMSSDYVWFATDWLSSTLDSFSPASKSSLSVVEGVVALRQHIPDSNQKRVFYSRWQKLQQKGLTRSELITYGLFAYDTVWVVAHALDSFINEHRNISFSFNDKLQNIRSSSEIKLGNLKVFDGGSLLLKELLETNFSGLTGHVQFDQDRNIVGGGYEVINIDQKGVHTVGFWSNYTGFSVLPRENLTKKERSSYFPLNQKLKNVIWPGGMKERPRGWVIADGEKPLRIGVPNRTSFVDFVTVHDNKVIGYCIDVFVEACKLVPYDVPYRFESFGDGRFNPSYDGLVKTISNNVFDAAVGDITIVKNRTKNVDFSQPYATTGLVIVAPISNEKTNAWVFLRPFTLEMWCVTAASFVLIAVVIWILEHRVNSDFRGPPMRQLATMFLFSFSTLFKKSQEDTISPLARMVMVIWLFLLMVITSSYTASLTSTLTVQQLSSSITGVETLVASNWPIGYQVGSFAYNYMTETLYIPRRRLVALTSPEEYEIALRKGPNDGGVAAIVDELMYVELFLSNQTDFGIIGQTFTRGGWGFAFQKGSPLAIDISTAILKLAENGELQRIHRKWFCKMGCSDEKGKDSEPNQLQLISFWGLYLLSGGFALGALLIFLLRVVWQFIRFKRQQIIAAASVSSVSTNTTQCSQVIFNFIEFIDEKEEAIKGMFTQSQGSVAN